MSDALLSSGAAFWLGFLTAISPCLMATNIAAITYIARKLDEPRSALISAAFYITGQALAYVALGALLVTSLLSVPRVSLWLQDYFLLLLGPFLIVTAMFLLELLSFNIQGGAIKDEVQKKAATGGMWISALLGIVFAMSFCPTTAAWFFGNLIPLAIRHDSPMYLPLMYALGVALPVCAMAILIVFAANRVGDVFKNIQRGERWTRFGVGGIILAIGFYFTLRFTFQLW